MPQGCHQCCGLAGLGTDVCVLCAPAGLTRNNRRNDRVGWVCTNPFIARLHFGMTMGAEQGRRGSFLVLAPPLPFIPSSLSC